MMDRRTFIKRTLQAGTFLAIQGTGLGDIIQAKLVLPKTTILDESKFTIDVASRTISLKSKSQMSVLELHRYLQTLFDDDDYMQYPSPTSRVTDDMFDVINGWKLTPKSYEYLCDGSVREEVTGDVYTNFYTLGNLSETFDQSRDIVAPINFGLVSDDGINTPKLDVYTKAIKKDVNILFKTVKNGERLFNKLYFRLRGMEYKSCEHVIEEPNQFGRIPIPFYVQRDMYHG